MKNNFYLYATFFLVLLFVLFFYLNVKHDKKITTYYANGKVKSIITVEDPILDKKCGIYYSQNGNIEKKFCVIDDKIEDTLITYYQNGQLKSKLIYKSGILNGNAKWYYPNGILNETVLYIEGEKEGILSSFDEKGYLAFVNFYQNDFNHYVEHYLLNSNGSVQKVKQNFIARIEFNKDTIFTDDTLLVDFILPLPHDSLKSETFYIRFDFHNGAILPPSDQLSYPQNKFVIVNGIASRKFKIHNYGSHILYGFVSTIKDEEEILFKLFEKSFYVARNNLKPLSPN